jgi:nucleoside-diphosphate kinase
MTKDKTYQKYSERTLVLIKPDAIKRQLTGRVIQRFEDVGLKIVGMKMLWVDRDFAKNHYISLKDQSFYQSLVEYLVEGPVLAIALEGLHAVEVTRKLIGSTVPKDAQPGTIRADFAHHSREYTDESGIPIRNIIHASGNAKEAVVELSTWFSADELHTYKTVHEDHVF